MKIKQVGEKYWILYSDLIINVEILQVNKDDLDSYWYWIDEPTVSSVEDYQLFNSYEEIINEYYQDMILDPELTMFYNKTIHEFRNKSIEFLNSLKPNMEYVRPTYPMNHKVIGIHWFNINWLQQNWFFDIRNYMNEICD